MEHVTCKKCEIIYNKAAGHQCNKASSYNDDDEFQSNEPPHAIKDFFGENSKHCIW